MEERYGGSGGASAAAATGTLLHELLQAALAEGLSDANALVARGQTLIRAATSKLLEVSGCIYSIRKHLMYQTAPISPRQ